MTAPLAEMWLVNNRVNGILLDELDGDDLIRTLSTRGGRTVGEQLAHVLAVRRSWLEVADKALLKGVPVVAREDGHDKKRLADGFERSGAAIADLIEASCAAGGAVKGFKRGIHVVVGYLVAHDAHHRGQILLTLKQSGRKLGDRLRWGLWDWAKI